MLPALPVRRARRAGSGQRNPGRAPPRSRSGPRRVPDCCAAAAGFESGWGWVRGPHAALDRGGAGPAQGLAAGRQKVATLPGSRGAAKYRGRDGSLNFQSELTSPCGPIVYSPTTNNSGALHQIIITNYMNTNIAVRGNMRKVESIVIDRRHHNGSGSSGSLRAEDLHVGKRMALHVGQRSLRQRRRVARLLTARGAEAGPGRVYAVAAGEARP
jgi:hypothetical protein